MQNDVEISEAIERAADSALAESAGSASDLIEACRLLDHGRKWLSYGGRAKWELEVDAFLKRVTLSKTTKIEQVLGPADDSLATRAGGY